MDIFQELERIAAGGPFDISTAIRLLAKAWLEIAGNPPKEPPPKPAKTKPA